MIPLSLSLTAGAPQLVYARHMVALALVFYLLVGQITMTLWYLVRVIRDVAKPPCPLRSWRDAVDYTRETVLVILTCFFVWPVIAWSGAARVHRWIHEGRQ